MESEEAAVPAIEGLKLIILLQAEFVGINMQVRIVLLPTPVICTCTTSAVAFYHSALSLFGVLNMLKDYVIKALVNSVDHLGCVAYKVNDLPSEQVDAFSGTELSDTNLIASDFLMKIMNKDPEGYGMIVSDDGKKVRRRQLFTERDKEELKSRTVIVENLPEDYTRQSLEKMFNTVGLVSLGDLLVLVQDESPNPLPGARNRGKKQLFRVTSSGKEQIRFLFGRFVEKSDLCENLESISMSETKDGGESGHEVPKLSSKEQPDAGVEEKDSPSLAVNPMDGHNHQLKQSEAGDFNNLGFAGTTSEASLVQAQPTEKNTLVTLASNKVIEDPALNNVAEAVKQVENASDHYAVVDVKKEKEGEVTDLQVESGHRHEKEDVKRADSENNRGAVAKEEKEEEDPPNDAPSQSFIFDYTEGEESGTEEDQIAFMNELEIFHRDRSLEFKPPKFYGEGLNCLKLWRAVTRLGGYDQVTSCKLWRQVGESFRPPKTCTTVSWSFRIFYEKALLEYEKHKIQTGELQVPIASVPEPMSLENQVGGSQASGSGRARRDAAARAMQGWHSQRLLGNGEVGDPIIKDKSSGRDKHSKGIGVPKRKKASSLETEAKAARPKISKPQSDIMVVDVGPPADWVKINVRTTKDCFEVYALVPGLLREEVHVQSDPSGRLVISGEPEQPDNPWGVTPFKKVITLSSRIDPHQTSAVVTLHGQLFRYWFLILAACFRFSKF
ncbi:hypothetical protein J5N97_026150 [Dioscorea zingiberensis]|uniref:ARID domain-containing protein n=1 Tax=Dioscorea zingiberensis TaxID=325984 RepID=A0A9D5H6K4_9LILI|nr:hypothetical protein J5N97_026150 [Dioscorea zingiberensis]